MPDVQTRINIDVDLLYGIEIEELPAQIAQVALWLIDHQINMKISEEFGAYFARIQLKVASHIVCANALQVDWASVLPSVRCSYVLGNPPVIGYAQRSVEQKADLEMVCHDIHGAGVLDFVAAWYTKAARCMAVIACNEVSHRLDCFVTLFLAMTAYAVRLSPPAASIRARKSAYCGAGCWHRALKSILRTVLLIVATKCAAKSLYIA